MQPRFSEPPTPYPDDAPTLPSITVPLAPLATQPRLATPARPGRIAAAPLKRPRIRKTLSMGEIALMIGSLFGLAALVAGAFFVAVMVSWHSPAATTPAAAPTTPATSVPAGPQAAPATATLTMGAADIQPTSQTLKVGGTLQLTNPAGGIMHVLATGQNAVYAAEPGAPATLNSPDGIVLNAGQTIALTFSQPGTYHLTCLVHPTMNTTVTVVP